MTVCIAAKAVASGVPVLVMCMDAMVSSNLGSTEHCWKHDWLAGGFNILISGGMAQARQCVEIYKRLAKERPLDSSDIRDILSVGIERFKKSFANETTRLRLGMSYEDLLKKGKTLPEDIYKQVLREIHDYSSDVQLIVCGFVGGTPVIFTISFSEGVQSCDDFAAIGCGAYVAQSVMMSRDYAEHFGYSAAFYCLYEAKRLSEKIPGVGHQTVIYALARAKGGGADFTVMTKDGIAQLERYYKQFGPQELTALPHMFDPGLIATLTMQPPPE